MHTVIGAFDDRNDAQRAVDRLLHGGIAPDDVYIEHRASQGVTARQGNVQEDRQAPGTKKGGLLGFFASLFGSEDQANTGHAHTFDEAVQRGSAVVVVEVDDAVVAEEAATLLHELGAVSVDEPSVQWRSKRPSGETPTQTAPSSTGSAASVPDVDHSGRRSYGVGGVRVLQRTSPTPLRDFVRTRREQELTPTAPGRASVAQPTRRVEGEALRERALQDRAERERAERTQDERERAVAAQRDDAQRDPAARPGSERRTGPGGSDKPGR